MEKGKHQIRVSSAGGGTETSPVDDGFSWRKYGQKVILGAQYPRLVLAHFSTSLSFSEPNPHMFSELATKSIFLDLDTLVVLVLRWKLYSLLF